MRRIRHPHFAVVIVALLALAGCVELTAGQTAGLFHAAAPSFDEHWDYDMAGQAAPGAIMQLEGVLHVIPDNSDLLLEASKSYVGYTYGWVEDGMERAEARGDMDEADHLRRRARWLYVRARDLGKRLLRQEDDGLDAALASGIDGFHRWLEENFDDADDAPALFWTGYAWGSAINVSLDDASMVADLAFAKALVERSVALDEGYYNAAGLTFLGYAASAVSPQLGGDPEAGRRFFERALTVTNRRALQVQLSYARTYAVITANRELFTTLLSEVREAPDALPSARMANAVAKRRAAFYLSRIDELIPPD